MAWCCVHVCSERGQAVVPCMGGEVTHETRQKRKVARLKEWSC